MKAEDLKAGQKFTFTPTGAEFEIAKVGVKNVSWYNGFVHKSGFGKNNLRMTTISQKAFQRGLDSGAYLPKN